MPKVKLNENDIINIYKYAKNHTIKNTSEKFNISVSTVNRITNKNYRPIGSNYQKAIDKWLQQ